MIGVSSVLNSGMIFLIRWHLPLTLSSVML